MFEYRWAGETIDVYLPNNGEHVGYFVRCLYRYIKSKEKYNMSMWLMNKNDNGLYKISGEGVNSQLVTSEKNKIRETVTKIVEDAYDSGFFDEYMDNYEYTAQCFYRGDELYVEEFGDGGGENV